MKKLPMIDKDKINIGCATCSTARQIADLNMMVVVGFGSACITKNGEVFYDGEEDFRNNVEPKTLREIEAIASQYPECDWRLVMYGPLHGETYQRHGADVWAMVESNGGFA